MAPGDFQAGCKLLADGFVMGLTLLTNVIWRSIEQDRQWHQELRDQADARESAHQARLAALSRLNGTVPGGSDA